MNIVTNSKVLGVALTLEHIAWIKHKGRGFNFSKFVRMAIDKEMRIEEENARKEAQAD